MNAEERTVFLEERASGFGGSDAAGLFDLPPYGCSRALWYGKRRTPPDFPFHGNKDTERGTRLEPIVREILGEETEIDVYDGDFFRHAEDEWLIVHTDGEVFAPSHGDCPGVLEVKCPRVRGFLSAKNDGLQESYILQLQHALLVTGLEWGVFAIFSAELWELVHFEVERDEAICERLRDAARHLWRQIENGPAPDRLDPDSEQCRRCQWRTTCQGAALKESVPEAFTDDVPIDDEIEQPVRDYLEAKQLVDDAEEIKEAAYGALAAQMGNRPAVKCSSGKVLYKPHERHTIDSKLLRKELPQVAATYERTSVVRPLRVLTN